MHLDKTAGRVWTHLQTQRLLVSPRLLDLVQIPAFRTNALTAAPPPPQLDTSTATGWTTVTSKSTY